MSTLRRALVVLASLSLLASMSVASTTATKSNWQVPTDPRPASARGDDSIASALSARQSRMKERALQAVLSGKATASGSNQVVQQGHGQFVELAQTGEDLIWTVIGDFGDTPSPIGILQSNEQGPQHNEIPQPDRAVDNSTIWTEDFSKAHYEDLLFDRGAGENSMANYYIEQSSGMYSVDGDVTDWVDVPFNTAHYGRDYCGDIVCATTWWFVEDSLQAWWDEQIDAGMTPTQIDEYLSKFDVWDRYDWDGDGDFTEADGYIDHFQSVHAGMGQETGGGVSGDDAIWSHRWYVQLTPIGAGGPTVGGVEVPNGGVQIGGSRYWVGDYTIEPENGGVGVFAHEFAHDLGLPDLYDTAGNTGGGENSTGFWTLMSSGSYGNDGTEDIGSKPVHMGAWEKVNLGWLNYALANYDQAGRVKLGPSMHITKKGAQALIVLLPDKQKNVNIGAAAAGEHFYYSSAGPLMDNLMYQEVTLPAGAPSLTAQVRYNIELDWDYAYVVVSTDGGATWTGAETNRSVDTSPHGQNFGNGITGSTSGAWVPLNADLSPWAGQTVLVGFRYWTDPFTNPLGFLVDEISIAGGATLGAEADDGFTFDPEEGGFHVSDGNEISFHFNAYIAEYRQYRGYDESLQTGPYNFGFLDDPDLQNYVEHFPYQDGLLVTYWDETFNDNNTGANCDAGRCGGLILPVDAHPKPMKQADGGYWRSRVQSYDSTFGLSPTDAITLHENSQRSRHPSLPAVPVFDDTKSYWDAAIPWSSVQLPGIGVTIRAGTASGSYMWVYLNE